MIVKLRTMEHGPHVDVQIFVGNTEADLASIGTLTMRTEEMPRVFAALSERSDAVLERTAMAMAYSQYHLDPPPPESTVGYWQFYDMTRLDQLPLARLFLAEVQMHIDQHIERERIRAAVLRATSPAGGERDG